MVLKLCRERVVVSGEVTDTANVSSDVMQDSLGDGDTIVRAGSTTKFIQNDQ
jgi:glyceraldehyde-3-phosphate dehydrogenase/erythrose-4-phosphate dehydrogenase